MMFGDCGYNEANLLPIFKRCNSKERLEGALWLFICYEWIFILSLLKMVVAYPEFN